MMAPTNVRARLRSRPKTAAPYAAITKNVRLMASSTLPAA
jgi:hypothetical protein